jgi:hypothetical protein
MKKYKGNNFLLTFQRALWQYWRNKQTTDIDFKQIHAIIFYCSIGKCNL